MNYSDSSDSDADTGRFKSSKLNEIRSLHKSYGENVSNPRKQMLAEEKTNDHFRRERISKSRDSKAKYSEYKERTSDSGHKSTLNRQKETQKAESKINLISSNSDVNRRRSNNIDSNFLKLDYEKKRKHNSNINIMDEHNETNNGLKSCEKIKINSHEKDLQNPCQSSKNRSPHRLNKKEKSVDKKSIDSNKYRSNSKTSHSDNRLDSNKKCESSIENVSFGPALPPKETKTINTVQQLGPVLPPGFKLNSRHSSLEDVLDVSKKNIGPQIPKNILEQIQSQTVGIDMTEHDFDKVSSSEEEEDDCSFMIGPMPTGSKSITAGQLELEKRALEIKIKKLDDAGTGSTRKIEDEREEWMIELPEIRKVADLGLGARQFRTKERPDFDDRTQWTNTPQVESISKRKEQKIDYQNEQKKYLQTARDQEQDKIATSHKKKNKRDSSLMEIHKKKLKKEKVNNY